MIEAAFKGARASHQCRPSLIRPPKQTRKKAVCSRQNGMWKFLCHQHDSRRSRSWQGCKNLYQMMRNEGTMEECM
ncbi:overexpressed in colon carcinoma 1 protein isoform X1 [Siphateles boraxobius]|uniref:overexpressed in colon carcinoma 1 protein isoform X1 n=1 Tax=Siphateles boraxobius TaxID=180520 RepID=UPI004064365C